MSYTITTVSRRRFMVKTKSKQGQSTPSPSQSAAAGTSQAAEPEMFIRAPYRRPVRVAPTPWWTNWLAITLVNALVVAVVGGLYVWANGADSDEGRYVPQRTMVRSSSPATTPASPAPSAPASSPPTAAVHPGGRGCVGQRRNRPCGARWRPQGDPAGQCGRQLQYRRERRQGFWPLPGRERRPRSKACRLRRRLFPDLAELFAQCVDGALFAAHAKAPSPARSPSTSQLA